MGAKDIYDPGLYFAWGELEGFTEEDVLAGKRSFNKDSYKFYDKNTGEYTKYNNKDGKKVLDPEDNIVKQLFGEGYDFLIDEDIYLDTDLVYMAKNTEGGKSIVDNKLIYYTRLKDNPNIEVPFPPTYLIYNNNLGSKIFCYMWNKNLYTTEEAVYSYVYYNQGSFYSNYIDRYMGIAIRPVKLP